MSLSRIPVTLAAAMFLALASAASSSAGSVTLVWTAPGGDSITGSAYRYDLRYSTQLLTPQNFGLAAAALSPPQPAMSGVTQSCSINGLQAGVVHYFAIQTMDVAGNWSAMSNVVARMPVEAPGAPAAPGLSFSPPWPNPATDATRFVCSLPEAAPVRVEVFDIVGRRIRLLADGLHPAGKKDLFFDLRDDRGGQLPGGLYLVRAWLGETGFTRRLVVAR